MYIYYVPVGILSVLLLWALGSYLVVRSIEKPAYTVIEMRDGYEIREYQNYLVAETIVSGDRQEALSAGFRIIADYIFGNNISKSSIAMTAPVLESQTSEKISMTTPVLSTDNGTSERVIAFVLPSEYTLETLPLPNNPAVTIREVPAHKVAAISFTWYATSSRIDHKKAELLALLAKDEVATIGEVMVAQYNPPLSMPLMLKNEIIVPIN